MHLDALLAPHVIPLLASSNARVHAAAHDVLLELVRDSGLDTGLITQPLLRAIPKKDADKPLVLRPRAAVLADICALTSFAEATAGPAPLPNAPSVSPVIALVSASIGHRDGAVREAMGKLARLAIDRCGAKLVRQIGKNLPQSVFEDGDLPGAPAVPAPSANTNPAVAAAAAAPAPAAAAAGSKAKAGAAAAASAAAAAGPKGKSTASGAGSGSAGPSSAASPAKSGDAAAAKRGSAKAGAAASAPGAKKLAAAAAAAAAGTGPAQAKGKEKEAVAGKKKDAVSAPAPEPVPAPAAAAALAAAAVVGPETDIDTAECTYN